MTCFIQNVSCDYCDRKVVIEPVLQSHLLSRHFRADCERAITQIFDLTDGRCPLCPGIFVQVNCEHNFGLLIEDCLF